MKKQPEVEPDNNAPAPQSKPSWKPIAGLGAFLLLVIVAWLFLLFKETPPPAPPPTPPPVEIEPAADSERERRENFYNDKVKFQLSLTKRANRQAAERALERVTEKFDGYRGGIKPFTDDITSWSTRIGVMGRFGVETWEKLPGWVKNIPFEYLVLVAAPSLGAAPWLIGLLIEDPVENWHAENRIEYMRNKFEAHLFSEDRVRQDILAVLDALREDLEANQNRLLARVRIVVISSDIPDIVLPESRNLKEDIQAIISEFSDNRASDSVYQGVATLVVVEAAAATASAIVVRIVTAIGTTAATSAAAGGGAAGAGAATGGAAGTPAGPVGIAIGVGVGLVIGVIVDWWMTDQFKQRLSDDLDDYLQALQIGLLDGTESEAGLKTTLDRFIEDLNYAQEVVLRRAVVGGP